MWFYLHMQHLEFYINLLSIQLLYVMDTQLLGVVYLGSIFQVACSYMTGLGKSRRCGRIDICIVPLQCRSLRVENTLANAQRFIEAFPTIKPLTLNAFPLIPTSNQSYTFACQFLHSTDSCTLVSRDTVHKQLLSEAMISCSAVLYLHWSQTSHIHKLYRLTMQILNVAEYT